MKTHKKTQTNSVNAEISQKYPEEKQNNQIQ